MTDSHDEPVLAIFSASNDGEAIAAAARLSGWRPLVLRDPAALDAPARPGAFLIDARDGVDARRFAVLPRNLPCVALVDGDAVRATASLAGLGITHFLPWPCGQALLAATLNAAVSVQRRIDEAGRSSAASSISEDISTQDALTGLSSRNAARDWLNMRIGGGKDTAAVCLLLGISQFANVNAAYGEVAGDAVLARVASRIGRSAARLLGQEAMIARMGGTEYLVAYERDAASGQGDLSARDLARRILADITRPFVADGTPIRLTARCGIAASLPGDDAARLLRRASAALADARRSGTIDIVERSAGNGKRRGGADDLDRLEADLRLALDAGEIGIVYQPQYDSLTDIIVGVEALARWNHPKLGQLDAGTLFEAADRSDYLLPLSRHIQRTALTEAGAWPASLAKLRLSINVTAVDVAQEDFLPQLLGMIVDSGFPGHRVTVEITESGLIENIDRAGTLLQELRREELRVAIDDFGTGYSSLAYLKALHPDCLKIDHSLSRDIVGTPRDRIILRAVIAMAHSLAMTVIAEGVESEEQLKLLAREGCDIYQGFLRSPAVTSGDLAKLVSA